MLFELLIWYATDRISIIFPKLKNYVLEKRKITGIV